MIGLIGIIELLSDVFFFLGYFSSSNTFYDKLSPEEERECIRKMRSENDSEAREKLIVHNLRLVAHVTKKYSSCSISQEDLLSIGTVGLIKGINTFEPEKGSKFASYVAKCIDNEILMALRSESKAIRNVYLEDVIGADEEGNNITLTEIIGAEDDIAAKIDFEVESKKLIELIEANLTEREKTIIYKRYGLKSGKKCTQIDIAKDLGISRSYVSRIETKAIEKLSKSFNKLY